MNLTGNSILITGGSSGIGLALAKRLLALGNKVIITGRNPAKLEALTKELAGIHTFHGDLSNMATLEVLATYIQQHHADLNILINNAGVQYNYTFLTEPELAHKIDYEIQTNLTAPIKLTGLLLPLLLQNAHPAIVNVSSGLFMAPKQSAVVYCATKAAIHSYTKALRYQLEGKRVSVFEIIPPLVDTPMTAGRGHSKITSEQLVDEFLQNFHRNRLESYIGKAKLLRILSRLLPGVADRMMRGGV